MTELKLKMCPECRNLIPEQNFVTTIAIAKTGLRYKVKICYDCYIGEW